MKYRKKSVVIEAFPVKMALSLAKHDWYNLPDWLQSAYENGGIVFESNQISINTLEGTMIGNSDDFIIQGVKGELYVCKPDIFEATYESV